MYGAGLILNLEKFVLAPWRPAQLPAIPLPAEIALSAHNTVTVLRNAATPRGVRYKPH
jgi:hypothetical protein